MAFSCKRRGFCPSCAARRITESAALLVDEVLPRQPLRQWVFSVPFPLRYLFATDPAAMGAVLGRIVARIARHLEWRGLVVRDAQNSYLSAGPGEDSALEGLLGHSITYRIAVGPNEGRKAFRLQTLVPALTAPVGSVPRPSNGAG